MAWTAPVSRATGYLVLATDWNNEHVNNLLYLHGDAGVITLNNRSDPTALSTQGPTSAGFTGSQPGDGGFIDSQGQFASFCNAAVQAFAAGSITDTVSRWAVDSNGNMGWGLGGSSAQDLTLARAAPGVLKIGGTGGHGNYKGGYQFSGPGLPATFTPDTGYLFNKVAPINISGTLTIAAPTNAPSTSEAAFFFIEIRNPGSGVVTLSWNAVYQNVSAGPSVASAALTYFFVWNPGNSKWSQALTFITT